MSFHPGRISSDQKIKALAMGAGVLGLVFGLNRYIVYYGYRPTTCNPETQYFEDMYTTRGGRNLRTEPLFQDQTKSYSPTTFKRTSLDPNDYPPREFPVLDKRALSLCRINNLIYSQPGFYDALKELQSKDKNESYEALSSPEFIEFIEKYLEGADQK
ncbi:rimO [Acrasis kona]|uniref:RimO n=1 Tax=Acrasis kona TaxID=1008807 RepID=A0AAW2ZB79_9EUKA